MEREEKHQTVFLEWLIWLFLGGCRASFFSVWVCFCDQISPPIRHLTYKEEKIFIKNYNDIIDKDSA